jgi:hypothetical protein
MVSARRGWLQQLFDQYSGCRPLLQQEFTVAVENEQ